MSTSIDIYPEKIANLTVHKILDNVINRLEKPLEDLHKKSVINISCSPTQLKQKILK